MSNSVETVAVLMGGLSAEREVSLVTGKHCSEALESAGYSIIQIDAAQDLAQRLVETNPDVVFNALHGRWGEDGCVQGMLEWLEIPYTHSGVMASAVAMNKLMAKSVYNSIGLPSPQGLAISSFKRNIKHPLEPPYVIKPVNEGSSVGVTLQLTSECTIPIENDNFFGQMMIEEYVPGRELTVSVLKNKSLTVTEIITDDWYDYGAKYTEGKSRHIVPARIPVEIFDLAMSYALMAHNAIGCRGLSRTDFRWNDELGTDGLFLLETNTQPGMTPTSLSPEQADICGISLPELCQIMVEDASCPR